MSMQDDQPFRFACDSIKDCKGQIIQRIGATVIIEGLAMDSGYYFAKGKDGTRRFKTKREAVDLAGYWAGAKDADCEGMDDSPEENAKREFMKMQDLYMKEPSEKSKRLLDHAREEYQKLKRARTG